MLIPSAALDLQFFHANFKQNKYIYTINYDMAGWGWAFGFASDVCMQHRINRLVLRYGVDIDLHLLRFLYAYSKYSGDMFGTNENTTLNTMAEDFVFTVSPYICIGFKL